MSYALCVLKLSTSCANGQKSALQSVIHVFLSHTLVPNQSHSSSNVGEDTNNDFNLVIDSSTNLLVVQHYVS